MSQYSHHLPFGLSCSFLFALSAAWAAPLPALEAFRPAWVNPSWGFVEHKAPKKARVVRTPADQSLHKSLLFDQSFDSASYRPLPAPDKIDEATENLNPVVSSDHRLVRSSSWTFPKFASQAPTVELPVKPTVAAEPVAVVPPTPAPIAPVDPKLEARAKAVPFRIPKADRHFGKLLIVSEESIMLGNPQVIEGATAHWVGTHSGLNSKSNAKGSTLTPYPNTHSMRFVVTAPNYLPAVGYAVQGAITPVIMISESRLAPILQSLGVVPDSERSIVLGKMIDRHLKPIEKITIDASTQDPFRVFYSLGSFGLFHNKATETGSQGDFLISGLRPGIQYIMPTQGAEHEWPPFIGDFTDLPPVVSLTIQESTATKLKMQVVDGSTFERPDSGIQVTLGGQRGVYIPDEDGFVSFKDAQFRSSTDLVEIHSPGYLKTWLNPVSTRESFPDAVSLFSSDQINALFKETQGEVDTQKGVVLGTLRLEDYIHPVSVQVFGPQGKRSLDAKIFYFDSKQLRPHLTFTDRLVQSFAVGNLPEGEWHVVISDANSHEVVASQIVRTQEGTISEMQF